MSAPGALHIALLHMKIQRGALERNREELVGLAEQAADAGAQLIVAPELAVSGYLTECRAKVKPSVEGLGGITLSRLSQVAKERRVFLCAGFAEHDLQTDVYFNSAVAFGPGGAVVALHRKVLSERRWASPGAVTNRSRFDTPWGRIGLLICADVYCGLLPRTQALHGVDLLLVPSNWPDCGLDPRELWRARALENGFGIVACNRTGCEPSLDFSPAHSYAVTGDGTVLEDFATPESGICHVHYPLQDGKLAGAVRDAILARRSPEAYAALSLSVNGLASFSGLWNLPEAGQIEVKCIVPAQSVLATANGCELPRLLIAPPGGRALDQEQVSALTRDGQTAVVTCLHAKESGGPVYGLSTKDAVVALPPNRPMAIADFGPARIALAQPEALRQPEMSVALSKQGCDLVVTGTAGSFDRNDLLVLGVKSLDRLAVVMVSSNGASICIPPTGHERWKEETIENAGECCCRIDTALLRRKYFEDRLDLPALLQQ